MLLDKPEACYTMHCPLAACRCEHDLDQHSQLGERPCEAIIVVTKKTGKGKTAVLHTTSTPCPCRQFHAKGTGFVLGTGDPRTARLAIQAEGPGAEEVAYRLGQDRSRSQFDAGELLRRRRDYPELSVSGEQQLLSKEGTPEERIQEASPRFIQIGAPLVGKSGRMVDSWCFRNTGIQRFADDEDGVFIDNTLRCLPPKSGKGASASHYPKGEERKEAEKCCRHWDRWALMNADIAVIGIHPAAILREVTPLPLLNKGTFERARDFVLQGYKVICALGGKAAKRVLGYGENTTRWSGEYKWLAKGEHSGNETPRST